MPEQERATSTVASVPDVRERSTDRARRRFRRWVPLGLAGLCLALAGCAKDAPLDTFQPRGDQAQTIYNLAVPVFVMAGIVLVIVLAVTLFIILKFGRRKGHENDIPKQIHGAPRLEVMWTIAPAVLLAIVAVFTVKTIFDLAKTPKDPLQRHGHRPAVVVGVPLPDVKSDGGLADRHAQRAGDPDRQVRVAAHHSRETSSTRSGSRAQRQARRRARSRAARCASRPTHPGIYDGQCTEFCGLSHANMHMRVGRARPSRTSTRGSPTSSSWRPTRPATSAKAGQTIFKAQCTRCHQINGLHRRSAAQQTRVAGEPSNSSPGRRPNLTHLMSRTTFAGATYDLAACRRCTGDLQRAAAPAPPRRVSTDGSSRSGSATRRR